MFFPQVARIRSITGNLGRLQKLAGCMKGARRDASRRIARLHRNTTSGTGFQKRNDSLQRPRCGSCTGSYTGCKQSRNASRGHGRDRPQHRRHPQGAGKAEARKRARAFIRCGSFGMNPSPAACRSGYLTTTPVPLDESTRSLAASGTA